LVVILVLALLVDVAHADDELARARQLEAALEYDQALAIVEGILARGGVDPSRYVELHLFAGRLAGGLDRAQLARDHFARALAIRPETTLPDGTSPKLTEPFAAANARTTPLEVRVSVARGLVTLAATDPLGLVTGVAVHVIAAGKHADIVERATLRLVLPDGATPIEVAALDASGNRLWVGPPPVEAKVVPIVPNELAQPPVYARWTTWAVLGGATLLFGGISAWRFDAAQDEWDRLRAAGNTDFTELEDIEQRGRRWALAANLSLGIAAASSVAAVILGVRGRASNNVVITPNGSGIAVTGRF
jgi:hypothetical protein